MLQTIREKARQLQQQLLVHLCTLNACLAPFQIIGYQSKLSTMKGSSPSPTWVPSHCTIPVNCPHPLGLELDPGTIYVTTTSLFGTRYLIFLCLLVVQLCVKSWVYVDKTLTLWYVHLCTTDFWQWYYISCKYILKTDIFRDILSLEIYIRPQSGGDKWTVHPHF